MAEAKADAGAPAQKSKKGMLVMIIVAVLVLILAIGGALAFFLLKSPADGGADDAANQANAQNTAKKEKKKKEKGKEEATVFAKLQDQPFTVNLSGDTDSVLQVEIMVELPDEATKEKLASMQPKIQDAVNRILRSKTLEDIKTVKGEEALSHDIKEKVNQILDAHEKDEGVLSVNFTKYFYQ